MSDHLKTLESIPKATANYVRTILGFESNGLEESTPEEDQRIDATCHRIAATRIMIAALPDVHVALSGYLLSLLKDIGFDRVVLEAITGLNERLAGAKIGDEPLLILSIASSFGTTSTHEDAEAFLYTKCLRPGISWFRTVINIGQGLAEIGPVFTERTTCLTCFKRLHGCSEERSTGLAGQMENETASFCAGLIATKLIAYIVLDQDGSSNRSFTRFRTNDWTSKDLFAVSLAGCDRCAPRIESAEKERSPTRRLHAAVVFEQALSVHPAKPRGGTLVEDLEKLYKALASQSKVLRDCMQLPLDRSPAALAGNVLELLREPSAKPESTLSAAKLAALLTLTAGIRHRGTPERPVRRWAASGGNLGSVELFLVTRGVAGLSAGAFFYQPKQHTLARLERWVEPFSVEEAMHLLAPAAPDAQAVVIFTSALSRLKRKYGPFAYKLSNLDTGVAIAQMHLVTRSLGLWSQTQTLWPDDVAESMCALSAKHERVTAVVALSGVTTNTLKSAAVQKYRLAMANETAMSEISHLGTDDLLDYLDAQSRTVHASLITTSTAPGGRHAPEIEHFERLVPPNTMHTLSVGAVLTGRRSFRTFASSPVQLEQISTLLYNANASDSIDWPSENKEDQSLIFFLAAKRVEGLTPALYRFDARDHMLHAVGALPTPNQEKIFFRGHDYSSSAFFVWICGNLQAACDRQDAFGYRELLLRAGAAGNRIWLSALALNLGGTLIAGIDSEAEGLPQMAPYYAGLLGFIGGVIGIPLESGQVRPATQSRDLNIMDKKITEHPHNEF